jgi:hypothetical protein
MGPIERGKRVRRLGELIAKNAAKLARLEDLARGAEGVPCPTEKVRG